MSYRLTTSLTPAKNFFSSLLPVCNRILQAAAGGTAPATQTSITKSGKSRSSLIFLHKFTDQLELNQPVRMLTAAARLILDLNPEQTLLLISVGKTENEMIIAGIPPAPAVCREIAGLRDRFSSPPDKFNTTDVTAAGQQLPASTPQRPLTLVAATEADSELNQLILYTNGQSGSCERELLNYCLTHLRKRIREARKWHKLQLDNRIDSLSGLNNRRCFDEIILKESERSERYSHPTSLIMLDLDHFKEVNDNFGHQTGDMVLKNLGKVLLDEVRLSDTPCRYGGEEFAVILPETRLNEARRIAERIRKTIARQELFTLNNSVRFNVTASIGVASTEQNDTLDLVECADQALYQAKENGRNQTVAAAPTIVKMRPAPPLKNLDKPALSRCFQNLSVLRNSC